MLRGQSREATIIRAANSETRNPGSGTGQPEGSAGLLGGRAQFLAQDLDLLEIRDIALHNSTRRSDGHSAQAETIFFSSDQGRLLVRNAHFISEQDTLQLHGYAWFHKSLIEGNVDFVWGNNRAALFEDSELRTVGDSANPDSGGYIVQARTVGKDEPGFIFLRSRLTRGPGPLGNLPPTAPPISHARQVLPTPGTTSPSSTAASARTSPRMPGIASRCRIPSRAASANTGTRRRMGSRAATAASRWTVRRPNACPAAPRCSRRAAGIPSKGSRSA